MRGPSLGSVVALAFLVTGCLGPPSSKYDGDYDITIDCPYYQNLLVGPSDAFKVESRLAIRDGLIDLNLTSPEHLWLGNGSVNDVGKVHVTGTRRARHGGWPIVLDISGEFVGDRADLTARIKTISATNCAVTLARAMTDPTTLVAIRQGMAERQAGIDAARQSLEVERERAARDIEAAAAERARAARDLAAVEVERRRMTEAALNAKTQAEFVEVQRQRTELTGRIEELERQIAAAARARAIDPALLAVMRTERRHALVVGNGDYRRFGKLQNAVNDARAMSASLRRLGFDVTLVENADQRNLRRAVLEFGRKIDRDSVGLFYYAGHAVQVRGENYLLPADADTRHEDEVEVDAIAVGQVLSRIAAAGGRVNIAILDACRDNPLQTSMRSASRGLAVVSTSPTGMLIAYATGPNRTAADGTGANGLFTEELLKHLETPELRIEDVFKRVIDGVETRSGGQQVPWLTSSLKGDFYFKLPN